MSWASENRWWRERARERWAPSRPEPLLVRAWLDAPVAYDGYDPLTLEGALQCAVVARETGRTPDDVFSDCPLGADLADTDIQVPIVDTVVGDIPIAHASIGWFSPDAIETKRQNWKRADAEHYNRPVVKISQADTKTQMVAKATVTALHVDFYVEGDREKLRDLLLDVPTLGASRAGGLGMVLGWEVVPVPMRWWWYGPGRRLMRSLPLDAIGDARGFTAREATLRAPYWHPRTRRWCGVPEQRIGEPMGEARGRFFITGHAVRRFRERIPGRRKLGYSAALAELVSLAEAAHYVRTESDGTELWRGPSPTRVRLIVSRQIAGLPQVLTVRPAWDGLMPAAAP